MWREKERERKIVTLVTADSFVSGAAVARSGHIVTGGVVHTFTQLLAAVAKCPGRTFCKKNTHAQIQLTKAPGQHFVEQALTHTHTTVTPACDGGWETHTHTHINNIIIIIPIMTAGLLC